MLQLDMEKRTEKTIILKDIDKMGTEDLVKFMMRVTIYIMGNWMEILMV